jgi:hypothetical protein
MRKCLARSAWSSLVQLTSGRTETAKSSDRLMTLSFNQTHEVDWPLSLQSGHQATLLKSGRSTFPPRH